MKPPPIILARLLAIIGLVISAYLLTQKLNGNISSIKGCGESSDCANVLGSQWSQWFGLPVSTFSTALYLGIIGLTFKPHRIALLSIALLLIGSALWFTSLQLFVIKSFCPWCVATHLTGLLTTIAIWRSLPFQKKFPIPVTLSLLSISALILGQVFGPEPKGYLISEEIIASQAHSEPLHDERVIDMGIGTKIILGQSPYLGPADAPHVLVKYFDYTCSSCLDLEKDLEQLQRKHPEKVAIILQPCPLNRSCNPHLNARVKNHPHACELARLSLASWIAKPEAFPEVHRLLFSRPILSAGSAKEQVAQIIGSDNLESALNDPKIGEILNSNTNDYRQLASKSIKMPKLLIGKGRVLQGLMKNSRIFISAMEKSLHLP